MTIFSDTLQGTLFIFISTQTVCYKVVFPIVTTFNKIHLCISKIAMSSVYYNFQICYNKPRQHSNHRLSMAMLNRIGFNTDPWCTPKLLINAYSLFCAEMF